MKITQSTSQEHLSVLFVDDEANILKSIQRLFRKECFNTHFAQSGREALSLIEAGLHPCVIVSDQRMPGMNGAEFLALAKKLVPQSIRMMLTGYSELDAATSAINEGGISRYISKPWHDKELLADVNDAIARWKLLHDNERLTLELKQSNSRLKNLNENLEKIVADRTKALEAKLKELEGRNLLQEHLLTIHPLEETLSVVMQVVKDVLSADGVCVYLNGKQNDFEIFGRKDRAESGVGELLMAKLQETIHQRKPCCFNKCTEPFLFEGPTILMPILSQEECLGVIEVQNTNNPFSADDITALQGFSMQAALGIRDSKLQDQMPDWDKDLGEMFEELS